MKKTNLILCILAVVIFLAQIFFLLQPFYTYTPKPTLLQKLGKEPMPEPLEISLEGFVWTEYTAARKLLDEKYLTMEDEMVANGEITDEEREMPLTPANATLFPTEDQLDVIGEKSNHIVLGVVLTTVCGAVMAIMTIFTRKSWVEFMFSVFWAVASLVLAFDTSNIFIHSFGDPDAIKAIIPMLQYLSIGAIAVVVLRAFPWFMVRWMPYKLPMKTNWKEKNWIM